MAISLALGLAIASFVVSAVSAAYQVVQAKKAKEKADEAAEARRGFEIVDEGAASDLALVYGRALIGGTRVWHASTSTFKFVASNADKVLQTGATNVPSSTFTYTSWTNSPSPSRSGTTTAGVRTIPGSNNGYLNSDQNGTANEFLFFQQAVCVGPIQAMHDVVIDQSRYINDPALGTYGLSESDNTTRVKAAMRIDCHYGDTAVADAIATANFVERATAVFQDMAWISAVVRIDRDDPQHNATPNLQFIIEGRLVPDVVNGAFVATRTYSNNGARCLLDYLLDPVVGKGVSLDELDLASFEAGKTICATIVQTAVTVGGKIYQPTDGSRNVNLIDLPLYECNVVIDPRKPARENIEAILSTMGDARLVWSAGKYRLNIQYPATTENIVIADTINDENLIDGQTVDIIWPSASERLNSCTIRFKNEFEGFKDDSVSWPPKVTSSFWRGVGGTTYGLPTDSWDDSRVGGRLLNSYGVWDGDANSVSLAYKFRVTPDQAGTYTVAFTADDYCNITIFETNRPNSAADLQVFNSNASQWRDVATGTVVLGDTGGDKVYRADITATNTGGKRGVAAKIDNAMTVLWTTRDPTYSSFVEATYDSAVYDAMLLEDGGLDLPTEIFAEGITDPYHALAKAEELVRTSRSAFTIKFKYQTADILSEPGDFMRFSSESLKLGVDTPLYLRVSSVKLDEKRVCEMTASRFDVSQLAWNVKDDVNIIVPSLYESRLVEPSDIVYTAPTISVADSSGSLSWSAVPGSSVAGYVIYMHNPGVDGVDSDGQLVFNEIGRSVTPSFPLPPINAASAAFGVRTLGIGGRKSVMTVISRTLATTLVHNWLRGVYTNLSTHEFVKDKVTAVVSPSTITATAVAVNFIAPTYKWYVNGVLQSGQTTSTFVMNSFSNVDSKSLKVVVDEGGAGRIYETTSIITYREEAVDGTNGTSPLVAFITNEAHTVATDSSGAVSDFSTAGGSMRVFEGATERTTASTFSVVSSSGVTIAIDATTGVYTVTAMSADTGTATLRAEYGGQTRNILYSISKSRAGSTGSTGTAGANAKLLVVISDRQTIAYTGAGVASPTTQTSTFTAQKQNTTASVTWSVTDAAGVNRTPVTDFLSAATGDSVTMTEAQFASARNGTAGVIVTGSLTDGSVLTDKISVVRVASGATGATGAQGDQGVPGATGADGITFYTWIAYADNSTGTSNFTTGDPGTRSYIGIANNKTTATEGTTASDYTWSLIRGADGATGTQGVPGTPGADGVTTYTWFAYADNADGSSNFTTGAPGNRYYIGIAPNKTTATESITPSDYAWSLMRGANGTDGIPGATGPTGATLYTWIAYADNSTGTSNFTTGDPGTRAYIGIANNKTTATEGTTASDYTWSLIRGADGATGTQGVPGTPGANGVTTYTWFAYADSSDGNTNFTTGVPGSRAYIGVAPNKTTATESTTPGDYAWSLIRGADGATGSQGPQGPTGLTGSQGVPGSTGPTGATLYTWIAYADNSTGISNFTTGAPGTRTYIGLANNKTTDTESTTPSDYTWSLIRGADGATGTQGVPGTPGADGSTTYTWFAYADSADGNTNFTTGVAGGRFYLGVAPNKTTATEGTTPSDYTWSLIRGADGGTGPTGPQGPATYTWTAYADSVDGNTNFTTGTPGSRTYLGIAANKTTATEGTTPSDYTWSLIQGPTGPQGPTGSTGSTGATGPAGSDANTTQLIADLNSGAVKPLEIQGMGQLAKSPLTEVKVRGRYLGEHAGDAAANTAGIENGDTYIDISLTPYAFKVKTGNIIKEVDTSGLFRGVGAQVDITSTSMTDAVTLNLTNIQANSYMVVWMTMDIELTPGRTRKSGGASGINPSGTWEIVEDATGGNSPKTLDSGDWVASRVNDGVNADHIEYFTIDGTSGESSSDVSRSWRVRAGGSRTWKLRMRTSSGETLLDTGLSLLVQIQRNPA